MESWMQSWHPRTSAFCNFSSPCFWSIAPATKKRCQVIQSAAPVTQNHLSKPEDLRLQNGTSLRKSAPWLPDISDEHVSCTAPATRHASLQILFKCPTPANVFEIATKPHVLLTFDKVHNPLRRPRNTTPEHPKVLRTRQFLTLLTSKCASRHNCVHIFNISSSKSAPSMVGFVHFDLEMCFAPQRRPLFRHHNFQKCSDPGVFYTFWLGNVLTACTFSISQLPQLVRPWCVFCSLTWKRASRHNGAQFSSLIWPHGSAPAALASLLFDPLEPQTIRKT